MFTMGKVKLDKELIRRASEHARKGGFASVEDFVAHLIEQELKRAAGDETKDKVVKQLKGLGYL